LNWGTIGLGVGGRKPGNEHWRGNSSKGGVEADKEKGRREDGDFALAQQKKLVGVSIVEGRWTQTYQGKEGGGV